MKKFRIFIILFSFCLLLTACSNQKAENKKQVNIVTSTNIYANIAKNIVGKYGKVSSIISNGNTDPHDFEPTVDSAKEVANANIVIANGLGYDDWMNKLADSNNKSVTLVGEDLLHLKKGANPHIWYNLKMPEKYVHYLVKKASKIDPKHKSYFRKNGINYIAKIKHLKQKTKEIDGQNKKPVFVSEPVFDYALLSCKFQIGNKGFEKAIEAETDPTAQSVHEMQAKIKQKKISFFVNNTQASSSTVESFVRLCENNKIPVLNVRETMPNNTSYYEWISATFNKLAEVAK